MKPEIKLRGTIEEQADSLIAFRDRLKSRSNLQALDKLDYLIRGIYDMYGDAVKYPQLELPQMQMDRLEGIIEELSKP